MKFIEGGGVAEVVRTTVLYFVFCFFIAILNLLLLSFFVIIRIILGLSLKINISEEDLLA